jgi:hypothetical protein
MSQRQTINITLLTERGAPTCMDTNGTGLWPLSKLSRNGYVERKSTVNESAIEIFLPPLSASRH